MLKIETKGDSRGADFPFFGCLRQRLSLNGSRNGSRATASFAVPAGPACQLAYGQIQSELSNHLVKRCCMQSSVADARSPLEMSTDGSPSRSYPVSSFSTRILVRSAISVFVKILQQRSLTDINFISLSHLSLLVPECHLCTYANY